MKDFSPLCFHLIFIIFNILASCLSHLYSPDIQQNQILDLYRAFVALLHYSLIKMSLFQRRLWRKCCYLDENRFSQQQSSVKFHFSPACFRSLLRPRIFLSDSPKLRNFVCSCNKTCVCPLADQCFNENITRFSLFPKVCTSKTTLSSFVK